MPYSLGSGTVSCDGHDDDISLALLTCGVFLVQISEIDIGRNRNFLDSRNETGERLYRAMDMMTVKARRQSRTVKARFWSWLEPFSVQKSLKKMSFPLVAQKRYFNLKAKDRIWP